MSFSLTKMNPKMIPLRDQTIRAVTAAVAGPALIVAGIRYPGTLTSKVILSALGGALIYVNYSLLREALEGQNTSEENPDLDESLSALSL